MIIIMLDSTVVQVFFLRINIDLAYGLRLKWLIEDMINETKSIKEEIDWLNQFKLPSITIGFFSYQWLGTELMVRK